MKKCDCGCGSTVPNPPYQDYSGKEYASAYCLLRDKQCCSYCGGYYGKEFDPKKHDFKCSCNFAALDQ